MVNCARYLDHHCKTKYESSKKKCTLKNFYHTGSTGDYGGRLSPLFMKLNLFELKILVSPA